MASHTPYSSNRKQGKANSTAARKTSTAKPSKLDRMIILLRQKNGVSLEELCKVTGWQSHSVRGAIAGSLKKKGHLITSEKIDSVRRYRIGDPS
ncbi:DUF3489 domain-containing protein [uncultured Sneathiella sp.]|jgi:hypothetical protein|uniref:DUF3489 domain-containing protein n=1 Tax=uncultured Sneathiella sp. TaxID=879315 RepID=UPI0030DA7EC8|tara:strand:- start:43926 stop:44207 length:282 start_codon:yes stop_codon:yes gene_type:complete